METIPMDDFGRDDTVLASSRHDYFDNFMRFK